MEMSQLASKTAVEIKFKQWFLKYNISCFYNKAIATIWATYGEIRKMENT